MADEAGAERDAAAERTAASAGFGLHDKFACRVFEHADTDVILRQARFELLGNLGQHFVGVERGDGITRNGVEKRKMTRFGALLVEEPRVFDGNACLAGEHTHEFKMPLVKRALVFGKHGHRADGVVIRDKRHPAEAAVLQDRLDAKFFDFGDVVIANKHRLTRTDDVLRDIVACGTAARRSEDAVCHFYIKPHFVTKRVERANVKILDIKQAAELFPDFVEEILLVESRAEGAPNLVEDVKLLGAAGGLLDEVAILDSHANLVAEGEKEPVFGGSKAARIRSAQEQYAKGLLLGLKADCHDAAQSLCERELAETADRLFALQSSNGIIIAKVPEPEESAEA